MNGSDISSKIKNYNYPKNAAEKAERLKKLFDDYSDIIPDKKVHSNSKNPFYKVRVTWWNSIYFRIEGLKHDIPSNIYDNCMSIFENHRKHIRENGLTRKEDIEAINSSAYAIFQYFDIG